MQLPADGLAENRNEVVEARLRLRAEVVGRVRVLRRQCVHDAVRDVTRIDEVARLAAVAEDNQRLALRHALCEDADDATLALVALALTVDIGKAQHDVVEAVERLVEREIALRHDLRQPVERHRCQRQLLLQRQHILFHIAVSRRRRGEDHALHPARARRLQHIDRAEHILARIKMRVANRRIDHRLASQMDDRIKMPRHDAFPRLRRPVIELPERKALLRQMLPHPRRQIIQHRDLIPKRHQPTNKMRTNKTSTASDQNLHSNTPHFPDISHGSKPTFNRLTTHYSTIRSERKACISSQSIVRRNRITYLYTPKSYVLPQDNSHDTARFVSSPQKNWKLGDILCSGTMY